MAHLWVVAAVLSGCRCTEPAPVSHVGTWPLLVDAACRGDGSAVLQYAEALTFDEMDDGGASEAIGAAVGFLRFAEDETEIREAVEALADGCARCHAARGVEVAVSRTRECP